ncbi:MAG: hypothetical protein Q9220_001364 [cf. Caloplaca sp. 1 TL-2023]
MLKRPCAIAFTPNESEIICGDKFGDVYALPLLPKTLEKENLPDQAEELKNQQSPVAQTHTTSASLRTVHTLRNQLALKHQQKHSGKKPPKTSLGFKHQLLLGHVSLLTDLVCMMVYGRSDAEPQDRTYIISADRDEHIRVSRGIPQSHIIEGFCLGHTQFVSKLCVPAWNSKLLISGGGDDYLLVWDWLTCRMIHKINIREIMTTFHKKQSAVLRPHDQQNGSEETGFGRDKPITVSDIHALEVESTAGEPRRQILMTLERLNHSPEH